MAEREVLIEVSGLDSRFSERVLRQRGGEAMRACFQCGLCTASCPVSSIDANYSPRKIIKKTLLGMRQEVLKDRFIWLCSSCFLCQERCPQDVRPPEVMTVLKNLAVSAGLMPPGVSKMIEIFRAKGRLYSVDDFMAEERENLDLPSVKPQSEIIKRILEE